MESNVTPTICDTSEINMFNGFERKVLTKKKSYTKKGKKDKFLKNLRESEICQGDARLSSFILSASFSATR